VGRALPRASYASASTSAPPSSTVPAVVPVSLPDDGGRVTMTVPLGAGPTRFRLPLSMSVYDLICELKEEMHTAPTAPVAAPRRGARPSARQVRVVDDQGYEVDHSLPLSEALKTPFTIDLGDAAIQPDGRAFVAYLQALRVEQGELRSERDYLDTLEELARRRTAWRGLAARLGFGSFLLAQLGATVYLTYDIGWDIMEPTTYLIGLGNAILGYGVYLYTRRDFSFAVHMEAVLDRWHRRHLSRIGFDPLRRDYVRQRLERLERLLLLYDKETGLPPAARRPRAPSAEERAAAEAAAAGVAEV
jgi:hypothetical protein